MFLKAASPSCIQALPLIILSAYALDLLLGDPRRLPHPVVFMGRFIESLERFFRRIMNNPLCEKICGILLVIILVALSFFFPWAIIKLFSNWNIMLGYLAMLYLLYTTLSLKGLLDHVINIEGPLKKGDLIAARQALSLIVGRDTENLQEKEIIRAAAESLAESASDGVIAPLFYAFLGGAPLAMAYKAVNTMDSMVGYQNKKYINFGWAAAKLDDLANYIPARLTAFFMLIAALLWGKITPANAKNYSRIILQESRKHSSPNSGYPEAAAAVLLNVSLGGTSSYAGIISNRPTIFEEGRAPRLEDLKILRGLVLKTSFLALFSGTIITAVYLMFV
ncbi:MAG: adenosylcobinamide-phosphate synthase CbiB [Dethiobacteria bacterium]|jgi:adenosylcobinamide-phosphate synthase